jgi:phosphoenolpyruvate carboxylase
MQPIIKEDAKESATYTGTSHQHEQQDVKALVDDLKRLLVHHEKALNEEGIRDQVEVLERWMESYRRGLSAANKIAESGMELLPALRSRLKLAVDEMQRLEGEGGTPGSKAHSERLDEFQKAITAIDKVIPDLDHLFTSHEETV